MPYLDQLQKRLGAAWPAIMKARDEAGQMEYDLCLLLASGNERLDQPDTSIVVFGSLARGEWTSGSDVDWTLLIDGSANPEHHTNAVRIEQRLRSKYNAPGQTGVFGNMAFSHQIIHQIGGQDDTNRNTTHRILLLLESLAIGDDRAHDRVLTATLQRYLEGDASFVNGLGGNTVPRFLLNDIVRFWRTVAVDFAAKQRDRSGTGWGLRNAKLRMSRKLIFAAGLLICFDCHLNRPPTLDGAQRPSAERPMIWLEFLKQRVLETPLEIVSRFLYGQEFSLRAGTPRFL